MKIIFTMILVAFCAFAAFAQGDIEKDFEKTKLKYKLEKFSEGEDATSGYDYFVYKDKGKIVKVRVIWSSSQATTYRAEDYYFQNSVLIAYIEYSFDKKYYKTAEKGKNIPLKMVERLIFTNGKLSGWTENGKPVPPTDKRWQEKESEAIESGKSQLENYKFMKEDN